MTNQPKDRGDGGCRCVNIAMGSYANQERHLLPFATTRYPIAGTKPVGIDRCILPTIEDLWARGIETIESCCGHGLTTGYIAVTPEHEPAMEVLGYHRDPRAPHVFVWPAAPASTIHGPKDGRDG